MDSASSGMPGNREHLPDVGELLAMVAGSNSLVRGISFALLLRADLEKSQADLVGLPEVRSLCRWINSVLQADSSGNDYFWRQCRRLWPDLIPGTQGIIKGPGFIESDEPHATAIAEKCLYVLRTRLLSDVVAVKVGCLLIGEETGQEEIRTSELTRTLRYVGYRIPNPAALVRSLSDRIDPVVEVLDQKIGPRQELVFRLLPNAAEELRSQLLSASNVEAA